MQFQNPALQKHEGIMLARVTEQNSNLGEDKKKKKNSLY